MYKIKGDFTARVATVQTKATGFPEHHLTAKPGWYIVQFPFDASDYDGNYSGYPLEIPLPPEVFHANFEEVKTTKKVSKCRIV